MFNNGKGNCSFVIIIIFIVTGVDITTLNWVNHKWRSRPASL